MFKFCIGCTQSLSIQDPVMLTRTNTWGCGIFTHRESPRRDHPQVSLADRGVNFRNRMKGIKDGYK